MIEKTLFDYLNTGASFPVYMEVPEGGATPPFAMLEKTGGGTIEGHIGTAMVTIQSYGRTLYEAAETNEAVKALMATADALDDIARVRLNSDYNYTDTTKREYRYQAVFDIIHY